MTSSLCVSFSQIGVLATLLTTISGVVCVDDIWVDEWDVLLVSLQVCLDFKPNHCWIAYGKTFELKLHLLNISHCRIGVVVSAIHPDFKLALCFKFESGLYFLFTLSAPFSKVPLLYSK